MFLPQAFQSESTEMCATVHVFHKKHREQSLMAANDRRPQLRRLYIMDRTTRAKYLIETGSDVSIYPAHSYQRRKQIAEYRLYAANGTIIPTYGTVTMQPNLKLRRAFPWRFIIVS